jgi:hypothetical protein
MADQPRTADIPAVPLRTPMFITPQGSNTPVLHRTWQTFFTQLTGALAGVGQGTASSSSDAEYSVPIASGVATPDASQANNVLVLTAADCLTDADGNLYVKLAAPINASTDSGMVTRWSLTIEQDPVGNTGGYSVLFDSTYYLTTTLATKDSPANTQCHADFKTTAAGNTSLAGLPSVNQPIAP